MFIIEYIYLTIYLNYIEILGIEGLVHAYITCTNGNVKFNIEGVGGNVMKVLHQVKLDTIFNII